MPDLKEHVFKIPVILYIIGFLIYSLYLSRFGYHSFDFLQPIYLTAGLCFVGFLLITISFTLIRMDLSWLANTFKPKNLFPWLLRVSSFSYVIWLYLYEIDFPVHFGNTPIDVILNIHGHISVVMVIFTLFDLIGMMTVGEGKEQRITRSILRVISIPMLLITVFVANQEKGFYSILMFNMYIVTSFIGICIYQIDKKHEINPPYLDEGSDDKTQLFTIKLIGNTAAVLMTIVLCINFSKEIYPKIPSHLGGPRISSAEVYLDKGKIDAEILLINSTWLVLIDNKTNKTNKIRTELINKIVYK